MLSLVNDFRPFSCALSLAVESHLKGEGKTELQSPMKITKIITHTICRDRSVKNALMGVIHQVVIFTILCIKYNIFGLNSYSIESIPLLHSWKVKNPIVAAWSFHANTSITLCKEKLCIVQCRSQHYHWPSHHHLALQCNCICNYNATVYVTTMQLYMYTVTRLLYSMLVVSDTFLSHFNLKFLFHMHVCSN